MVRVLVDEKMDEVDVKLSKVDESSVVIKQCEERIAVLKADLEEQFTTGDNNLSDKIQEIYSNELSS